MTFLIDFKWGHVSTSPLFSFSPFPLFPFSPVS